MSMALKLVNNTIKLNRFLRIFTGAFSTSAGRRDAKKGEKGNEPVNNEPIMFFGSNAASWKAQSSRSGGAEDVLWYQPYVISASLSVFLLYFCVFREENDVDEKLGKTLFDHIDGLEESQLVITYKYNKEHNLDNTEVMARLKELKIDVEEVVRS